MWSADEAQVGRHEVKRSETKRFEAFQRLFRPFHSEALRAKWAGSCALEPAALGPTACSLGARGLSTLGSEGKSKEE